MKNSQPEGDVWDIEETNELSQYYGRKFRIKFSYIASDVIKDIVKYYCWHNYRVENKTLSTLYNEVNSYFYQFNDFLILRKITSLKYLSNNDIENFLSYLRTMISKRTSKPLSYKSQKSVLDMVKSLIRWCQLHIPNDVPQVEIFTGNEYRCVDSKLRIEFIPDEVVAQINKALKTEENPYLKYGIIILQSTGMRIGDLLKLRTDCIQPLLISGYTIQWLQHKGQKNKAPMPVRSECVQAVEKLIELTKDLRSECEEKDKNILMIHRVSKGKSFGQVRSISAGSIDNWLKYFTNRNNIMDANGECYNLTSHQFRRTLGTDMLSNGININVIQQVLGHADPYVTKRFYADVKDKERAEVFKGVGIIGNVNQLNISAFDSISEFEWFMANKEKGACMCDGYCTKPVVDDQICDRLLKRQKCYTCSRYITTPEYLEVHKQHLTNIEKQLEEGSIYGEHYAMHFISTIEMLKVIIERLEELQNGSN